MSEEELEKLRRRRLVQLRNRITKKKKKKEKMSKQEILKKVFVGRAWEVFNATGAQYPQIAERLGDVLVQLVTSGSIKEVSGQELYYLLRKMGLRVKLKSKIRIKKHGKLMSLGEKMRN